MIEIILFMGLYSDIYEGKLACFIRPEIDSEKGYFHNNFSRRQFFADGAMQVFDAFTKWQNNY